MLRQTDTVADSVQSLERVFRSVLRVTGANISLVSCKSRAGDRLGTIVSAGTSLESTSPTVLIVLPAQDEVSREIQETGAFCQNILANEHASLVSDPVCCDAKGQPFAGGDWRDGHGGLPYLGTSLASIFCRVTNVHSYQHQSIILGEAVWIQCDPADERMPLIWLHGMPLGQHRWIAP